MSDYTLKQAALRDLENIWRFSHQKWGMDQANLYVDKLNQAFSLIADTPTISRKRIELDPPVRIHPCQSHLIIYLEATENSISIIRILHKSMDIESSL